MTTSNRKGAAFRRIVTRLRPGRSCIHALSELDLCDLPCLERRGLSECCVTQWYVWVIKVQARGRNDMVCQVCGKTIVCTDGLAWVG